MISPLTMGCIIGVTILLIGAQGAYLRREAASLQAEDEEAVAEWEMHTAIALDDD